jgi:hypothetical protein
VQFPKALRQLISCSLSAGDSQSNHWPTRRDMSSLEIDGSSWTVC